jgi:UDP-N-acetyl-2-amino-2-deoxyglucuronate dehydrogenase
MAEKFGVGIIGCGGVSSAHAEAYQNLASQCTLVAVCDPIEANAQRIADQFGVDTRYANHHDLLADKRIDVVSVSVPHFLHAKITIDAAKAGKHVIVEKPMAMTVGEANEMIQAARANGVKLTVGSERVNPRYRFIYEKVLPQLGEIQFSWLVDFYFRDASYYDRAAWRGTWNREGGGVFVNQAIYTWDQWQHLLGGVDFAYGYWTNILHPEIEVEDIGYGLVHFRNGSIGKVFATSACESPPNGQGIRIIGENGELIADGPWLYGLDFSLKNKATEAALRAEFERAVDPNYAGRYQTWQAADFFDAIEKDREPIVTPETAKEALKILNGIHWHGWNHEGKFREWAQTIEDVGQFKNAAVAKAAGWQGGKLVQQLIEFVRSETETLEVPFL